MKAYVKPMVLELEDVAEGLYAASGDDTNNNENNGGSEGNNNNENTEKDDECWTLTVDKEQVIAHENIAKFRLHGTHPGTVHISTASTVTIVFSENVHSAKFEGFDVTVSGTTVTMVRQCHANAYGSLDRYDSVLELVCDNPDDIYVVSSSISCTKDYNVHGQI